MRHSRGAPALLLLAVLLGAFEPAAATSPNGCAGGGRAVSSDDGIGGTGARPTSPAEDDGIGGTGARPRPGDDDGVGGTGISAGDTGVIGTITGFASVCVGGTEIHYGATTLVHVDGELASAADLEVGQVVEVVASGSGVELTAKSIAVRHIVSGPVTAVDAEHGEITVAGQRVLLPEAELAPPETSVRVSGMRRGDGVIVASRVARATGGGDMVQVTGPLRELASGSLAIGGAEVVIDGHAQVFAGDEVRVVGDWVGDAIRVHSIEALSPVPFDGRVARVDLEGFARATSGGQIQIGPYAVDLPSTEVTEPIAAGTRVRVEGQVRDQRVVVERITPMNDRPDRPAKPDGGPRQENGGGFMGGHPHAHHGGPPPQGGPPPRPDVGDALPPRPEYPEGSQRPDFPLGAPPGPERPEIPPAARPERPERPEIPHAERPERPELPERPGPPERPERPEPPEPPERPERPERP